MMPSVGCSAPGRNGFQFSVMVPVLADTVMELFAALPGVPDVPEGESSEHPAIASAAVVDTRVRKPRRLERRREKNDISGSLSRIAAAERRCFASGPRRLITPLLS